jgi:hypothetical protein
MTMGAGNVWQIADSLLAGLKEKNAEPRSTAPAVAG